MLSIARVSLGIALAALIALHPQAASAGDFLTVGQTGAVKKAGNGTPCFETKDAFDAYASARSAGDAYGARDAMNDATILRPGWRVRLLRAEAGFWGGGHSLIRLESGPHAGTACWVKLNPAGFIE